MTLFITGMFFSGTSPVAELVLAAGSTAEDEIEVLAPQQRLEGHREDADVADINDEILSQVGSYWDAPDLPKGNWWEELPQDFASSLYLQMNRRISNDLQIASDPRFCLLLPLWDRVFAKELPIILCVREPIEVARLLNAHDGLPLLDGLALWSTYYKHVLDFRSRRPAIVVDYSQYLADQDVTLNALRLFVDKETDVGQKTAGMASLGLPQDPKSDKSLVVDPLVEAAIRDLAPLYDQLSSHHLRRFDPDESFPTARPWADDLLRTRHSCEHLQRESSLRAEESDWLPTAEHTDGIEEKNHSLTRELEARSNQLSVAQQQVDRLTVDVSYLSQEVDQVREKLRAIEGSRSYRWSSRVARAIKGRRS